MHRLKRLVRFVLAAAFPLFVLPGLFLASTFRTELDAQSLYWEEPIRLSRGAGAFPQAVRAGPAGAERVVAVWQEYETSATASQAWLSMISYGDGPDVVRNRFAGPFAFSGSIPVLFSLARDDQGSLAIAVATAQNSITFYTSNDGGVSFDEPSRLTLGESSVSPRVFPRAAGGWYIFVTQGNEGALSISYSWSQDGINWQPFRPFLDADSDLRLNFLPSANHVNGVDYVIFQSLAGGERPSFQLFSRSSRDGGLTWSAPRRVTDFAEPVLRDRPGADEHDNQRGHLARIGNELWYTWERRALVNGNSQVYLARLDAAGATIDGSVERVTLGQGTCAEPRLFSLDGKPAVSWFDDRRGSNRVFVSVRDGLLWRETDLSGRLRGDATFGRAVYLNGGLYAFWQTGQAGQAGIIGLVPDTTVRAPLPTSPDFRDGARARRDRVTLRWNVPQDSSGILGFSWLWSQDPAAEPPLTIMELENVTSLVRAANEDGPWYFSIRAQDYAGNWSEPGRITFVRDTTPPGLPTALPPAISADGFLASNTFTLGWRPPEDPDVAGYAWRLDLLGPLDRLPARRRPAGQQMPPLPVAFDSADFAADDREADAESRLSAPEGLTEPGYAWLPVTAYEQALWSARPLPLPAPLIRSAAPSAAFSNIDDGYYVFTVVAIDTVGNVGEPLRYILRADKFRPFTRVSDVNVARDDFGTINLRLIGRGFADDGPVTRIVLDQDGVAPYEREYSLENRQYRIVNDRVVEGIEAADLPEGNYRIGVFHPERGWLFTQPLLVVDVSGTIKFGPRAQPWQPRWTFVEPVRRPVDAGVLFLLSAALFSLLGFVLSGRQLLGVVRETLLVREEARAILEGKVMPQADKDRILKKGRARGGLLLKFSITVSFLVMFVVALVSIPLSLQIIESQSEVLASGLEQRVNVLLESVSQGARSYLPARNLLELALLPGQGAAMAEVSYVTLTGYPADAGASPDTVWASNDPDILNKIDSVTLNPGVSTLEDSLSSLVGEIASTINQRADQQVAELSAALQTLAEEGRGLALRLDAASEARLSQISAVSRDLESTLKQRLAEIADVSVASYPAFDAKNLGLEARTYLFYKPVLYRLGNEPVYFRGLVRMEVSTELIVAEVLRSREALIRSVAIIAALALAVGILGSFILASIIINPIRKIVQGVEKIRDTEDKKLLGDFSIQVRTKDELSGLARTIEQMTSSLVHAAQEAEFLTVGKEVQKMFIPLIKNDFGEKLTTGFDQRPTHSYFGYYEGAKGVSGDYFDYKQLDDRYWAFIKCDVAGKGIPAALIMVGVATIFATEFQGWSYKKNGIKLEQIVYKVNDFIDQRGFKGRFAAFIMGVYDSHTGAAYLCNAGDNLLRQYIKAENKIITHELPSSPTAGTFGNDLVEMKAPFQQVIKRLAVDDVLLLYTDGFEESSRARRGPDFRQIMERKIMTDREGKESIHVEPGVEQLGEERIQEVAAAVMQKGNYVLRKEDDPLGPNTTYNFDFSACEGTVEDLVMGIAAVEKVFRMIPAPDATEEDMVMVDAKIDRILKTHFKEYERYCGHQKPHPDSRRTEYLFYTHLRQDDQYDDLTMMIIKRNT